MAERGAGAALHEAGRHRAREHLGLQRPSRAATSVEVGYVWINESSKHFLGAPFGGTKQSGFGREGGLHGLEPYLRFDD